MTANSSSSVPWLDKMTVSASESPSNLTGTMTSSSSAGLSAMLGSMMSTLSATFGSTFSDDFFSNSALLAQENSLTQSRLTSSVRREITRACQVPDTENLLDL